MRSGLRRKFWAPGTFISLVVMHRQKWPHSATILSIRAHYRQRHPRLPELRGKPLPFEGVNQGALTFGLSRRCLVTQRMFLFLLLFLSPLKPLSGTWSEAFAADHAHSIVFMFG